jgi:hypothetical protein
VKVKEREYSRKENQRTKKPTIFEHKNKNKTKLNKIIDQGKATKNKIG